METTDKMGAINDLTDQLIDSPKMISEKLPWNDWTSCIEDSENKIPGWIGTVFKIGAFALCVALIYNAIAPLWENETFWSTEGEGATTALVGSLVSMLLWTAAAFPISQIFRRTGENLGASKSSMVSFVTMDIPVAMIKLAGNVLAMIALFGAVASVFSFITTIDINSFYGMDFSAFLHGLTMTEVGGISEAMNMVMIFDFGIVPGGDAWTIAGGLGVLSAFLNVVYILIALYINLAIFKFAYGLLTNLLKWIQGPYLPFKSL